MRRKTGLYTEIILTFVLVVGAALVFGGLLLLRLTERELLEQKVETSRQLVAFVADAAIASATRERPEDIYATARSLLSQSGADVEAWTVFDRSFQAGSALDPKLIPKAEIMPMVREVSVTSNPIVKVDYQQGWIPFMTSEPGDALIVYPLKSSDRLHGVLAARFTLAGIHDRIEVARNLVFLYIFLYGAVLVAFGVIVLGRNVVKPVRRLREATSRVAAGDLSTNVEVAGPGEIADLAVSFNLMTEALQKGREELLRSERMASVGHLSAGMAHEIGNPLGAVIGYLELLKSELEPGREREIIEHSLAEIARIDRLIKDLLDYAAPAVASETVIDPADVLHNAIDMVGHQAAFEGFAIDVDCPESLPNVRIDAHKLTQVLVNLLLNARDSMESIRPIRVMGFRSGEVVKISVRDEGSGMSEETLQNIFDPFFTTKPQGKGRGLGLTVCHRIISEAGGRIEVESSQDAGTVLTISLPIEREGSP